MINLLYKELLVKTSFPSQHNTSLFKYQQSCKNKQIVLPKSLKDL
jgi:hypothetical protein